LIRASAISGTGDNDFVTFHHTNRHLCLSKTASPGRR
jgi:hypothetical protein